VATVLVADGDQRSALAVVRSLGSVGHDVFVTCQKSSCLAGVSRHAKRTYKVPDPLESPKEYARAIAQVSRARNVDIVLPNTEASLLSLLPERDGIPALVPWPALTVFQAICDKARVAEAARTLGITVPRQQRLEDSSDPVIDTGFPVVIKPSRSVVQVNGKRAKVGVSYAADRSALTSLLQALPNDAYPVLVQERIEGDGVGVFVLIHQGELIAAFSHRRLREKPPSGGVSVLRESIPLDAGLLDLSLALLRSLGWNGPAMVEYKVDASGTPHIMEINGRFWGSLQLAIDAGVDFPRLFVDAVLGKKPRPVTTYRIGVRSRWFLGDVDHLLTRLRRRPEELALPRSAPSRFRTAVDFLTAFGARNRSEVLRLRDPLPAMREALDWISFAD